MLDESRNHWAKTGLFLYKRPIFKISDLISQFSSPITSDLEHICIQISLTSVRQWADPRQAWVLQPDEYQCGYATAEPDTGVLLLREYPQPEWWLYGGYGH